MRHGEVRASEEGVERSQWWVFTFGCGHLNGGHYVRIFGTLEGTRAEMMRRYGTEWAFQYSQRQWDEAMNNLRANGWPVETELEEDEDD